MIKDYQKDKIRIPFGTISITSESKDLINKILDSGWVSSGKYVREFEEGFADLIGSKEAEAVNSGTSAIVLADRKSTRLNSSHSELSRMPSSA